MTTQSEHELEMELIEQLATMEYQVVQIHNDEEMRNNLKQQLEIHNKVQLSVSEFEQILNHLNKGSTFDRAKILRDRFVLKRDNNEPLYIRFFNCEEWCENEFQVTRQISNQGTYKNRYDVTLLINGLPLVQIELKRRGTELKAAFHQINRYQHQSYDAGFGLFQYIQLFIISNGVNTKYFANNKQQSFEQTFVWTDIENNPLSDLHQFVEVFLKQCHISKMISHYTVLNETDKILMVLRPYQFYAVEALVHRVKNSVQNGYVWHTTGSGKTLTSFKASQILSHLPEISKILFVVDRKDLDYQTFREFNAFSKGCVDNTTDTHKLVEQLKDNNRKLIVTTLQKLNRAIQTPRHIEKIEYLQQHKIIFIFDECHRSQFGETHRNIKKFFKNAQMFGFTGTPILDDNAYGQRDFLQTTTTLFDDPLHKYVIIDAIRDKNVLGFSVEYIGLYARKNSVNELDIDTDAMVDTKETLEDDKRLTKIVQYVLEHHSQKTKTPDFNAIFCVSNISTLIRYYQLFKTHQQQAANPLKIAAIFSYVTNEEEQSANGLNSGLLPEETLEISSSTKVNQSNRDSLEECIQDYNKLFNTNFSTQQQSFYEYYQDIAKRMRAGEIDILLVVNMFLTGFDSPRLNTLYVDKKLKLHGLIQAFSRTNRILNAKKSHGNIVCFRDLKDATDDAITLFSNKNAKETVLMKAYSEYLQDFEQATAHLLAITPTVQSVDQLADENQQKAFVESFREVLRLKNILNTFADFSPTDLKLKEQTLEDYKSKYLDLYDQMIHKKQTNTTPSILSNIDFQLELIRRDEINVAYILNLLDRLKGNDPIILEQQRKHILELLAGEVQLRNKRELITLFMNEYLEKPSGNLLITFTHFWNTQKQQAFLTFCEEEQLIPEKVQKLLDNYSFTNVFPKEEEIMNTLSFQPSVLKLKTIRERLSSKLRSFVETFIDGMGGAV